MYPMKLTAPLKDYIWGGQKLKTQFGKESSLERVAESWELSCHKDGESVIANGEYKGKTLKEFLEKEGALALGENCARFEYFPVLVKLIDACDNLSVQVHPDNEYAQRVEGEYGKTEVWYVVDCEPGAELIYGFKHEVTKEQFKAAIEENTLLELVNRVPVKKGDVFFIEAGTLHGIGKGILIAEIQQNSNTTYRVYDYGRVGADGKPRQLHIDKALDVTSLVPVRKQTAPAAEKNDNYSSTVIAQCPYFTAERLSVARKVGYTADNTTFHSFLCLSGEFSFESANGMIDVKKGDSVFIQANFGDYVFKGCGELIKTSISSEE